VKVELRISFKAQHDIILVGIRLMAKLTKLLMAETEELMLGSSPPSSRSRPSSSKWAPARRPRARWSGRREGPQSLEDSEGVSPLKLEFGSPSRRPRPPDWLSRPSDLNPRLEVPPTCGDRRCGLEPPFLPGLGQVEASEDGL
jgi:hypothetical protein